MSWKQQLIAPLCSFKHTPDLVCRGNTTFIWRLSQHIQPAIPALICDSICHSQLNEIVCKVHFWGSEDRDLQNSRLWVWSYRLYEWKIRVDFQTFLDFYWQQIYTVMTFSRLLLYQGLQRPANSETQSLSLNSSTVPFQFKFDTYWNSVFFLKWNNLSRCSTLNLPKGSRAYLKYGHNGPK